MLAYALALRVVNDPQRAEDVVQDAFLSVWRKAASYALGRGSVRTWLSSIVRNRAKIRSAVANAGAYLALQAAYGSAADFFWGFVRGKPRRNAWRELREIPPLSPEAEALSRALRERGFTFVGPTICYAFMQACGLVNDHLVHCFRYREVGLVERR